jgi:tRNA (cytidine/uridine-2'-O-)-methyltransferase
MPMRIALYQPDIPQNTGTIARLCACLGLPLDIVEPAGFPVSERAFRRAGLDYLDAVEIVRHESFARFEAWRRGRGSRLVLATTKAAQAYTDLAFAPSDILMLGRESAGVPDEVHAAADARVRVPMRPKLRSLNVAVTAAMIAGEALRQMGGFPAPSRDRSGEDAPMPPPRGGGGRIAALGSRLWRAQGQAPPRDGLGRSLDANPTRCSSEASLRLEPPSPASRGGMPAMSGAKPGGRSAA